MVDREQDEPVLAVLRFCVDRRRVGADAPEIVQVGVGLEGQTDHRAFRHDEEAGRELPPEANLTPARQDQRPPQRRRRLVPEGIGYPGGRSRVGRDGPGGVGSQSGVGDSRRCAIGASQRGVLKRVAEPTIPGVQPGREWRERVGIEPTGATEGVSIAVLKTARPPGRIHSRPK